MGSIACNSKGIILSFDNDVSDEDADEILGMIKRIRGVHSARLSKKTLTDTINQDKIKQELLIKIYSILN